MKIFEWVPNKSVGDLVFGMNREDCRKIMDSEYTPINNNSTDVYYTIFIRLGYDNNALLRSVEFCGNEKRYYDIRYHGVTIYPITKRQFFGIIDKNLFVKDKWGIYINYKFNLSIGWDDSANTMLVGRLNYMHDADMWLEETKKLDILFPLLKNGMHREECRKILTGHQYKMSPDGATDSYAEYLHLAFNEFNLLESAIIKY